MLPLVIVALALVLSSTVTSAVSTASSSNQAALDLLERFKRQIDEWKNSLIEVVKYVYAALIDFVRSVGRIIYLSLGTVGFLLWSTGFSRYTGKKMLIGAILLAFFIELLAM